MKSYLLASLLVIVGASIITVFAFIPSNNISATDTPVISDNGITSTNLGGDAIVLGGVAHIVKKDINGNIISEEWQHNRFVDTGEEFALDQIFQDAATTADNNQIGSICISDAAAPTIAETETAADFDGDNGMTETNCKEDTAVTTTGGQGIIGPLTFTCGGTNCANGDTVTEIAICQVTVANDNDFNDCATNGIMFSEIDITDVTLNAGETVDIDYTFDITSASN